MKNQFPLFISKTFLCAVLIFLINNFYGCSDSITNSTGTTAVTRQSMVERQFALSTSLKAEAGAVIVVDLEDLNSPLSPEDTGPIGEDIIPYNYTETAQHRFEIADSSNFKIKMVSNASGATIFELNPASFIVVSIPAGNYKLYLISLENYSASDSISNVVFIQPNSETSFTGSGSGNYSPDDVNTLLETRRCIKCHLDNANLSNMKLRGVTIGVSSLNNVNFSNSDIALTNFAGNVIYGTNFDSTDIGYANMVLNGFGNCSFKHAKLDYAKFYKCGLYTSIENVNLASGVRFSQCDLSTTNIISSTLANDTRFDSCFVQNNGRFTVVNSNIISTTFKNCRIRGAQFSGTHFFGMLFTDCDLSYSNFGNSYFLEVSFCGSDKTGINASSASIGPCQCWP